MMDRAVYDVFLGGSCGDTAWRRQVVIPHLRQLGLSYFDPQRNEWSEEMINEEAVAKENSSLFLFVLEPTTINATSLLEIAFFAARRAPKLVVVFLQKNEWSHKGPSKDVPDRLKTCDLLDRILRRHAVPMLRSIPEALAYIDRMLVGRMPWQLALRNRRMRSTFIAIKAHDAVDRCLAACRPNRLLTFAYDRLMLKQQHSDLNGQYATSPMSIGRILLLVVMGIQLIFMSCISVWCRDIPLFILVSCFLAFNLVASLLVSLICNHNADRHQSTMRVRSYAKKHRRNVTASDRHHHYYHRVSEPRLPAGYDVYMSCSGTSNSDFEWISDIAIPQLQKRGLSYTDSRCCNDDNQRLAIMAQCEHVLYYIPSCSNILSGMVEVAYFLGHVNWQVTVCVPPAPLTIYADDDDAETKSAIMRRNKCYAMALCYLQDMAARRHCRIFSRLQDALKYVIVATTTKR